MSILTLADTSLPGFDSNIPVHCLLNTGHNPTLDLSRACDQCRIQWGEGGKEARAPPPGEGAWGSGEGEVGRGTILSSAFSTEKEIFRLLPV